MIIRNISLQKNLANNDPSTQTLMTILPGRERVSRASSAFPASSNSKELAIGGWSLCLCINAESSMAISRLPAPSWPRTLGSQPSYIETGSFRLTSLCAVQNVGHDVHTLQRFFPQHSYTIDDTTESGTFQRLLNVLRTNDINDHIHSFTIRDFDHLRCPVWHFAIID